MKLFSVNGTYGSGHTPTEVFCATNNHGITWYVCEGSVNINATYDDIKERIDVETLQDVDSVTAGPINSLDDLEAVLAE